MMKGVTNKMDIWDIFIDFGLISSLLLVGVLLRSKVGFFQRSFMPASIIAGILGLILGTNGLGLLPFTDSIEDYPSVLIAVVLLLSLSLLLSLIGLRCLIKSDVYGLTLKLL